MRIRCRSVLVAVLVLVALGACQASLPHQWQDDEFGIAMHSDFPRVAAESMFDDGMRDHVRALQRLFGVESVQGLQLFMHDDARYAVGEMKLTGWHASGEVHVMAGWGASIDIAIPSISSRSTVLHELVHVLVHRAAIKLPRWFEEGLCEVLSESVVLPDGRFVLMPNALRERDTRLCRAGKRPWLDAKQLFSYIDTYPEQGDDVGALYAQATSFLWWLVRNDPPLTREAIVRLATLPQKELEMRFEQWAAAIESTPVVRLFVPFLDHESELVRERVVNGMQPDHRSEEWGRLASRLLRDPSQSVRSAMRIAAVCRPTQLDIGYMIKWLQSSDRQLKLAGQLGMAQVGMRAAGRDFCRALTEQDAEWTQPLLWLLQLVPQRDGKRRALDVGMFASVDAMLALAAQLADDLDDYGDQLEFDRKTGRYVVK